eukprot:CAMPEP_0117577326 /NCGR_PEP_ID=MMETSP0784-20121206/63357_1 /TAXON_ID=39447 /ORGANISM="" /LENGTH=106 /DNA_ID=CAMNT_0005376809 /DNA_START=73 /DNA_END=394 /DNA_ORIENTATION=-
MMMAIVWRSMAVVALCARRKPFSRGSGVPGSDQLSSRRRDGCQCRSVAASWCRDNAEGKPQGNEASAAREDEDFREGRMAPFPLEERALDDADDGGDVVHENLSSK